MNLDTALTRARALKTTSPKTAKHLYATVEWELAALEEHVDNPLLNESERAKLAGERRTGEAALAAIEEKYPGIKAQADEVEAPRDLSARAKDSFTPPEDPHDDKPDGDHEGAPAKRPDRPRVTARDRQRLARSRRRRSTVRTVTRTVRQVDSATGGWGDDAWTFILGGIGLSFLYLVLSHPTGLSNLMKGASNALRWVIDPTIDPLRPPTTGAKR